jgi:LPS sulfotransferase NodH
MTNGISPVEHDGPRPAHVIHRLYDTAFDFPAQCVALRATYMLATIPRSGSTLCAIKLWQSGQLGAPMEYLNFRIMGRFLSRLGYDAGAGGYPSADQISSYWGKVSDLRTSPNGVFGYKMFMSNFLEISRKYPHFLQRITPSFVIFLTRRDTLAQALSYSRAIRSKAWFAGVPNAQVPSYDYHHIARCMTMIEDQQRFWEQLFLRTGVTPLRISYEDLVAPGSRTVQALLTRMGLPYDANATLDIPLIEKQADSVTDEWRERFQADRRSDRECELRTRSGMAA